MRDRIKAIPTKYNGVSFRSKMESYFAKWCDQNRQKWEYEPEGLTNGKECYLPDFYLPDSNMIVEIKPAFFIKETSKLDMLLNCRELDSLAIAVIEMVSNQKMRRCFGLNVIKYSPPERDVNENGDLERLWATPDEICCVGVCYKCRSLNISATFASWKCTGCGFYDGEATIIPINEDVTRSIYVTR